MNQGMLLLLCINMLVLPLKAAFCTPTPHTTQG